MRWRRRWLKTAVAIGCEGVLVLASVEVWAQDDLREVQIAWWNVENLFDTRNDTLTLDDEFTPEGDRHWTVHRLDAKLQAICKTIIMMGEPAAVGLAEVENDYVLKRLCMATPLRMAGYEFVHHDSPDRRGIDCALLYKKSEFRVLKDSAICVSDSAEGFFTRDILLVVGITPSADTLCLLLNHWPSKLGGERAERRRWEVAARLREVMRELCEKHPEAAVVAMGDMNSIADEAVVAEGMGFGADSINAEGMVNLTRRLPLGWGSHKYQGEWNYLDHAYMLVPSQWRCKEITLIGYDHLLVAEETRPGVKPYRTYQGLHYIGGVSDHLPLYLRLQVSIK
ncbi:MAG: hypothetical protein IJU19_06415 [Bacteroidales bacterium]|nr:hypothetical protein [Bacteroidales bacterium]